MQLMKNSQLSLSAGLGTVTGIHAFDDGSLVIAEQLNYVQSNNRLYFRLTYWVPWRAIGAETRVSCTFIAVFLNFYWKP